MMLRNMTLTFSIGTVLFVFVSMVMYAVSYDKLGEMIMITKLSFMSSVMFGLLSNTVSGSDVGGESSYE